MILLIKATFGGKSRIQTSNLVRQGKASNTVVRRQKCHLSWQPRAPHVKIHVFASERLQSSRAVQLPGQDVNAFHRGKSSNMTRDALLAATNKLLRLEGSELSKVSIEEFSAVMDGWSKQAEHDSDTVSADYAYALLKLMETNLDVQHDGNITGHLTPDTACYNFVLHAFAVSKGKEGGKMAETILDSMIARCRAYALVPSTGFPVPPQPSQLSFNIVINAWAKTGTKSAGLQAEQVFLKMEDWRIECMQHKCLQGAAPNVRTLCGVMDAWAQGRSKEAAERVTAILQMAVEKKKRQLLGDVSLSGNIVTPVVIMFNIAIHAWAHSNQGKVGAAKAEEVLAFLIDLHKNKAFGEVDENDENDIGLAPTTRTFTLVMDAWARSEEIEQSGEGAQRAQMILEDMLERYRLGEPVKPNVVSYTTVASAWARCLGSNESAERAESVLSSMLQLYEDTGDLDFKPNEMTANTVITAWARSGRPDAADRAEEILRKMEGYCQPTITTYNSVLNAFSASGNFRKVTDVFQRVRDKNEIRPDQITYNTVISAAAKTNTREGAIQASQLLEEMENLYRKGNLQLQPSAFTFSAAINAWSKSYHDDQAEKAHKLFQCMLHAAKTGHLSGKVDVVVVTAFISACANLPRSASSDQKQAALRYAIEAFELFQSDFGGRPNQFTYRMVMKACQNLAQCNSVGTRLMGGLFNRCCEDGFVSRTELGMFLASVQPRVIDDYTLVPISWCRNVKPELRPQTRSIN